MGDIDGAGFTLLFAGEVMSGVALALLAVTAWAAAAPVDEDQAGGQQGRLGMKFFESGQEVAPDEGGVFGDFHTGRRAERRQRISRICNNTYPITQEKSFVRRNILWRPVGAKRRTPNSF